MPLSHIRFLFPFFLPIMQEEMGKGDVYRLRTDYIEYKLYYEVHLTHHCSVVVWPRPVIGVEVSRPGVTVFFKKTMGGISEPQ